MLNTLLFVHLVIALLLIVVILLQKTSTDGLSGIGGGGNNMGIMSGRSAANFLVRTTIILATVFFINAVVLANLSTQKHNDFTSKLDAVEQNAKEPQLEEEHIPIAK
jgi:preprotein translocase subunit SecG